MRAWGQAARPERVAQRAEPPPASAAACQLSLLLPLSCALLLNRCNASDSASDPASDPASGSGGRLTSDSGGV